MDVREEDLEILEAHLDGELSPAETNALNARLRQEGALNDALAELRRSREARVAAWMRLEPSDAEAADVAAMILKKMRSVSPVAGRMGRGWRYVATATAAAACVMFGVFIGRAGNNRPSDSGNPGVVVREVYEVALRDASGKVVAVQQFNSVEEAQQFASDLARWQRNGNRLATGQFVLTADRF